MPKPIITIENFSAGILADPTENVTNGGQMFYGLDIHRDTSTLQVSQKLTQETDVFTDLVKWIVRDENEATYKYWALGDAGNLYKSKSIGGTWSKDSNVGGSGQGLIVYNGERWHCTDTALVGSTSGSEEIDSDTLWHPATIYLGKLTVGAGRYIATRDADGVFVKRALTLPLGCRIKSIDVYGDRCVIGVWKGTNIYDQAESYLFTWDGITTFPEQSFYLEEHGQNALISWENILLDFAGIGGNVYAFNNAFLDIAKQVPNIYTDAGDYAYVNPGAVAQYGGNILAGMSIGSGSALGGVWEFGRKTEDMPFAMTLSHPISTGNTDVEIGAIMTGGANRFLASWKDGSNYGMDALDTTAKYSMGYFETQKYEIAAIKPISSERKLVRGTAITAEPMADDTSVVVKYKADGAGSWSTGGTIDSTNQHEVLYLTFRAKVAQLRYELNTDSNNSPVIKRIEIF